MPFVSNKKLRDLEAQVRALTDEVQAKQIAADERLDHLEVIIDGIDATVDSTGKALEQLPAPGSIATTDAVDAQVEKIQALQARLVELESTTASHVARIEARLAEITEQVLRQVEELGLEVEHAAVLAQRAADQGAANEDWLKDVTATQVKLAQEQVRYDLALRDELAELADRLRRTGRS